MKIVQTALVNVGCWKHLWVSIGTELLGSRAAFDINHCGGKLYSIGWQSAISSKDVISKVISLVGKVISFKDVISKVISLVGKVISLVVEVISLVGKVI